MASNQQLPPPEGWHWDWWGGALLTSAALPPCSPSLGSASVINLLPQMADLEEDQKGLLSPFWASLAEA